ncbi:hypothetical protein BGY98DRAFT_932527 [Russula aff. rugulosa BPL654]|nr:hypothetical protein BGY98DRAFT_932527 [Russula aff. rugulosa BPL654]
MGMYEVLEVTLEPARPTFETRLEESVSGTAKGRPDVSTVVISTSVLDSHICRKADNWLRIWAINSPTFSLMLRHIMWRFVFLGRGWLTSARVQRGHFDRGDTVLSVAGRRTMGTSRPEPAVVDMDIKQGTAGSVGWIATEVARRRFETLYVTVAIDQISMQTPNTATTAARQVVITAR